MLTGQKRKFALALMSGSTQTAAAITAGYSEKSARSKGSQLAKDPDIIAFMKKKRGEPGGRPDEEQPKKGTQNVNTPPDVPSVTYSVINPYDDPLEFLKSVMNNLDEDIDTRKDAAKAMLPYIHPKKGEGGKKVAQNAAAKVAASKFSAMAAPKLVVNNEKG
ncbi:terminase small subunit [Sodalis ligni]|uniref:Phage terminase small subunit n=1 Tax=Sodalis ligni TaxID=2697027 RepID=A0A4R1NLP9_9GAMM|nr:terminase small subunit [Sodalis ligni]TCL06901.1 phage terminase small subunit [Sodalis ligni]